MRAYWRVLRYTGAGLALAFVLAAPLSAQRSDPVPDLPADPPIIARFKAEAGRFAGNYWVPKLNAYKVRIDRALSPADLETLNRLRVRWAIRMGDRLNTAGSQPGGEEKNLEMALDSAAMGKMREAIEIFSAAKELAARYRADLDPLGGSVVDDLISFGGAFTEQSDKFLAEHREEFGAKEREEFTGSRNSFAETIDGMKSDEGRAGLAEMYGIAVEPLVMLYNGVELREVVQELAQVTRPVSGMEIPEGATLSQNFPNPASGTTTIPFNLAEPSSSTTLRLYNASGDLVATRDLRSRPAGAGSVEIEVSALASGSYLYQLVYRTVGGEQVASRRMQVVR